MIRSCIRDALSRDFERISSPSIRSLPYQYDFYRKDLAYEKILLRLYHGHQVEMTIHLRDGSIQEAPLTSLAWQDPVFHEYLLQKNLLPLLARILHYSIYSIYLLCIFRLQETSLLHWMQQIVCVGLFHLVIFYGVLSYV